MFSGLNLFLHLLICVLHWTWECGQHNDGARGGQPLISPQPSSGCSQMVPRAVGRKPTSAGLELTLPTWVRASLAILLCSYHNQLSQWVTTGSINMNLFLLWIHLWIHLLPFGLVSWVVICLSPFFVGFFQKVFYLLMWQPCVWIFIFLGLNLFELSNFNKLKETYEDIHVHINYLKNWPVFFVEKVEGIVSFYYETPDISWMSPVPCITCSTNKRTSYSLLDISSTNYAFLFSSWNGH